MWLQDLKNRFSSLLTPAVHTVVPPDSSPLWRVWMASEALPSLVAGIKLKLFDELKRGGRTESEIQTSLRLSRRAAKVLLGQLTSLGLLNYDRSRYSYVLAPVFKKYPRWRPRISTMIKHAVTPESYLKDVRRNAPLRHRFENSDAFGKIAAARFSFPILIASVELGLAKLLSERQVDLETITETLEIPKRYAVEMLQHLHAHELIRKNRQGQWSLTEAASAYASDSRTAPYAWSGIFTLMGKNPATPTSLLDAVHAEQVKLANPGDGRMMEHVMSAELARVFAKHMHSQGSAAAVAVAAHPVFRSARKVLDVAGGGGTYSIEIARRNPNVVPTILELGPMDRVAREWARLRGLQSRIHVSTGNMFFAGDWPKQTHDTIFFSHVLHDWAEDKIRLLLRNAFNSLPSGGRLVLHEILVEGAGQKRQIANAFSVVLYKWTEGRQYRPDELLALLKGAGFLASPETISPAHGPSSIIVARKPG